GSMSFTFTITRSGDTSSVTTVEYAVTGSGANVADVNDFTGASLPGGTVTFAAGVSSQVVTISVQGDTVVEANEGFTVTLSNASKTGRATSRTSEGMITNDDAITMQIAGTTATKAEGK